MPIHTPIVIERNEQNRDAERAQRVERRLSTIGGSESPALFTAVVQDDPIPPEDNDAFSYVDEEGQPVSPYSSPYQLAMLKLGYYKIRYKKDSLRQILGRGLERSISMYIKEEYDLDIIQPASYYIHPTIPRMGAQVDLMCNSIVDGVEEHIGIEIKMVADGEAWKWVNEVGELIIPLHIQVQAQHQMAVLGTPHHYIAVCFGMNSIQILPVARDDRLIGMIEAAIIDFWHHIEQGMIPEPNSEQDMAILAELYANIAPDGSTRDLTDNLELVSDIIDMKAAQEAEATAKAQKDEINERIKTYLMREGISIGLLPDNKILTLISTPPTETRAGSTRIVIKNVPKKSAGKKKK